MHFLTTNKAAQLVQKAGNGDLRALGTFLRGLLQSPGTATATAGAATLNARSGKVTSEAITTAAGSDYTLTLTNSEIRSTDMVFASVGNGTNTTEGLAVHRVQPANGSVVIKVRNSHASAALNGTIVVSYFVLKATA